VTPQGPREGLKHRTGPALSKRLVAVGILAVVPLLVVPLIGAQTSKPLLPAEHSVSRSVGSNAPIRVDVNLVLVNVTVTDPYNRLVTGLEQENFRVFEDGSEQEVVHFSSEDVPISIGVVFDMSGSMSDKVDKSRLAALQFFKTANPQDEFFLVSFNDRAELASPFPADVYGGEGAHGAARCHLFERERDESGTQHQEGLAHHIGWRRQS
jgi:hypothetical protein